MFLKKFLIITNFVVLGALLIVTIISGQYEVTSKSQKSFKWPEGKKAAISLSFDDARLSQVDSGLPLFDKYGVKATFYVTPSSVEKRLDGWKKAVASGHEIANHTLNHPCSGNFAFARQKALENYTLDMIQNEIDEANKAIKKLLGVKTTTYGYPCGQTFVGRGENLKSYVPLIAKQFIAGRLWLSESWNDPAFCDMAQLMGMESDGKTFEQLKNLIDQTVKDGGWLILAGHEIGASGNQTTLIPAMEELCKYAKNPANGLWIATVQEVANYVIGQRKGSGK